MGLGHCLTNLSSSLVTGLCAPLRRLKRLDYGRASTNVRLVRHGPSSYGDSRRFLIMSHRTLVLSRLPFKLELIILTNFHHSHYDLWHDFAWLGTYNSSVHYLRLVTV